MHSIKIITSTTREGRKGIAVANWVTDLAKKTGKYNIELLDLAEINLPFMDEPNHPRLQKYKHDHTKKWSETQFWFPCSD
jgi:NAD(P)H-dependent FMN reductase